MGIKAVTIVSGALTVADIGLAAVPMLSFTFTVKVDVPDDVGVPEMTPVAASSESPAGRFPPVIDHV